MTPSLLVCTVYQQVTEKGHFPHPEIPESVNVAWEMECLLSKVLCLKGWGRRCFGDWWEWVAVLPSSCELGLEEGWFPQA